MMQQQIDPQSGKPLLQRAVPCYLKPWVFAVFNCIVPLVLFLLVCRAWSTKLHFDSVAASLMVLVACALVPAAFGSWFFMGRKLCDARWPAFTFALTLLAVVSGCIYGNHNYWNYGYPVYELGQLATYVNIDPSTDKGQSYMDAGIINFKASSYVDVSRAIAFRSYHMYCAAPIVRTTLQEGVTKHPTDFWAVGMNCCEADGSAFTCGEVMEEGAQAGIRLVEEEQRQFLNLAVEEWSAQYKIPVQHPLFFEWVVEPEWNLQVLEASLESQQWFGVLAMAVSAIVLTVLVWGALNRKRSQSNLRFSFNPNL